MTLEADRRPRWYFYVLALLAYLTWAMGSNPRIADVLRAGDERARIYLAAAAAFIPAIDEGLTRWFDWRRDRDGRRDRDAIGAASSAG